MKKTKLQHRQSRGARVRNSIQSGTAERPRMAVFCSNRSTYVQIIDDSVGKTIVSSHSLAEKTGGNIEAAKKIGADIAQKAQEKKITSVVFDRNGYSYHGRTEAIADTAREGGLIF